MIGSRETLDSVLKYPYKSRLRRIAKNSPTPMYICYGGKLYAPSGDLLLVVPVPTGLTPGVYQPNFTLMYGLDHPQEGGRALTVCRYCESLFHKMINSPGVGRFDSWLALRYDARPNMEITIQGSTHKVAEFEESHEKFKPFIVKAPIKDASHVLWYQGERQWIITREVRRDQSCAVLL